MQQETLVHAFLNAKFDSMSLHAFIELQEPEPEPESKERRGIRAVFENDFLSTYEGVIFFLGHCYSREAQHAVHAARRRETQKRPGGSVVCGCWPTTLSLSEEQ